MNKRLALGTVQFGQSYGIANSSGQVSLSETMAILAFARSADIDTIDTAAAYGESEERLGEIGMAPFNVISKLPVMPELCPDVFGWVNHFVGVSLRKLRIERLHGLLVHRPAQLLDARGAEFYRALDGLRMRGIVEKIGISIYGPDELDSLWPHFRFDIVQAPFNIVDRRMAESGWLKRLRQDDVEIHVRSIFLQGLLLMSAADRPPLFERWGCLWQHWHAWLAQERLTPLQACLGFALSQQEIDRVIVGVDSLIQLQTILASISVLDLKPPSALTSRDLDLINPSRWGKH